MIENVRVLVDLEDDHARPAEEPVDAAAVIRNIADRYLPIARERDLELVWWCEPAEFGLVYGDASALDHVVTNLVDNATKFGCRTDRDSIDPQRPPLPYKGLGRWSGYSRITPGACIRPWVDSGTFGQAGRNRARDWGCTLPVRFRSVGGGDLLVESKQSTGGDLNEHHAAFTLSLPLDNRPTAAR